MKKTKLNEEDLVGMKTVQYHDVDGKPTTLENLVRNEPEWAANVIRNLRNKITMMGWASELKDETWVSEILWAEAPGRRYHWSRADETGEWAEHLDKVATLISLRIDEKEKKVQELVAMAKNALHDENWTELKSALNQLSPPQIRGECPRCGSEFHPSQ
jgi:hypothetical protein